ncbi:MAG: hypothetical protein ABIR83_08115 [Nakamurella sp.]
MATAADVRRLAAALTGSEEKPAWGQPSFRVRDPIPGPPVKMAREFDNPEP